MCSPCSVVFCVKLCNQCLYLCTPLVRWKDFLQCIAFSMERQCCADFDYTLCVWLPAPFFCPAPIVPEGWENHLLFFFHLFFSHMLPSGLTSRSWSLSAHLLPCYASRGHFPDCYQAEPWHYVLGCPPLVWHFDSLFLIWISGICHEWC